MLTQRRRGAEKSFFNRSSPFTPLRLCVSLSLFLCLTGCNGSDEPKPAVKVGEKPLVGEPLIAAKAVEPVTVAQAPEKFPGVNPGFVPENPVLPATGLPTADDLPPVKEVEGYEPVGFGKLAGYVYETDAAIAGAHTPKAASKTDGPPKQGDDQVPAEIKALDGKPITVQGYMVPIDFRKGGTNEFILVSVIPSCFFCQVPMPNQWVEVKMKDGERIPYPGDALITVAGTIDVGALFEGEYFRNLYRMEGHRVIEH